MLQGRFTFLSLALAAVVVASGTADQAPPPPRWTPPVADGTEDFSKDPFAETSRQTCSKCHMWPRPGCIPRGFWRERIQEMAQRSLLGTGVLPGETSTLWQMNLGEFVRYNEKYSPENLAPPEPWPAPDPSPLHLVRHTMKPQGASPVPIIANVRLVNLDGDARLELVASDMGHGLVFYGRPYESLDLQTIAKIPNPCHAEMVDLDKDGLQDLLVADLGDFLPADHEKGTVVWLRQTAPGVFESKTLIERLPRSADAQAADFNADGKLDLVVASYGWHTVGGTSVYENETKVWTQPKFSPWPVDARSGPIHVPIVDLNGDKRPDFVALIAQQYEHVVAFINRGPGKGFRPETIFQGPYPSFGSSGIQVIDLDKDGDLDVLYTNGDTLDDNIVKPFHGILWLENKGAYPFTPHLLATMPGVHRAQAADMDGDGDLDIVACAFLADPDGVLTPDLPSLVWLEQARPGEFTRHTITRGGLLHTTLDLGDYDQDGDIDIAVGKFSGFTFNQRDTGLRSEAWVEIWENLAKGGAGRGAPPAAPPAP
jgi:hypothetical protein